MGCVASKLDINDVHPNMFAVNNVDNMGTKLSSGQLEITDTDLILYQKGKQPVKWPLKYLKRYGFEAGLFSFEAGRKTPTGPGVYAFKCRRAEKLFNLLQVKVREQVPDRTSMSIAGTPGPGQALNDGGPLPGPGADQTTTTPSSPVESLSFPDIQEPPTTPSLAYINCNIGSSSPIHNNNNNSSTTSPSPSPGYLNITQELPNTQDLRHEYENIGPDTLNIHSPNYVPPRNMFFLPPKPQHLQQQQQLNVIERDNRDSDETASGEAEDDTEDGSEPVINSINYIVLDLDGSTADNTGQSKVSESSAPAKASRATGYVTIDFDKTDALIKSANHRYFDDDDPGIRKTRHNSSLSELGPVTTKLGAN